MIWVKIIIPGVQFIGVVAKEISIQFAMKHSFFNVTLVSYILISSCDLSQTDSM